MRSAARTFLGTLGPAARKEALLPALSPDRRRFSYLPEPRAGVMLADLGRDARKAAFRLLATVLSPPAFAQAVAVMALEEVLDRAERGRKGRFSDDYSLAFFGTPQAPFFAWRWQGHHLSASVSADRDAVVVSPLFLGANPASVTRAGVTVLRPMAAEEELARTLLAGLDERAVIAPSAPPDIVSGMRPAIEGPIEPRGIDADALDDAGRGALVDLVEVYLGRLNPELRRPVPQRLSFAWAGPALRGHGHYYRVQGPDLLIEYDNTANNANHAHTVLRHPVHDFGGDAFTEHLREHG